MTKDEVIGRLKEHVAAVVGERNPLTAPARHAEVRDYVAASLSSLKLGKLRRQVFNWASVEGINFVLEIPGRQEGLPGIVGAHYDSVSGSPGADDNASGVAILLELGRSLVEEPPLHTLWLVAFDLEEWGGGRGGSRALARELKQERQRPGWMVSLEMLGYRRREAGTQHFPLPVRLFYPRRGDFILVISNTGARRLAKRMAQTLCQAGVKAERFIVAARGWLILPTRFSDQSAFWDMGVPGVMLTDTSWYRNPNYHSATDTTDTLDFEFMADIAAGLAPFLREA
jgi:Zn-dependent M28 family amino/carboxypeptidase